MPRYLVERVWSVDEEEMAVKGPLSKRILAENEQFSPITWEHSQVIGGLLHVTGLAPVPSPQAAHV
jgi:hypothetical protein